MPSAMRPGLLRLAATEMKLFVREPLVLIFCVRLPRPHGARPGRASRRATRTSRGGALGLLRGRLHRRGHRRDRPRRCSPCTSRPTASAFCAASRSAATPGGRSRRPGSWSQWPRRLSRSPCCSSSAAGLCGFPSRTTSSASSSAPRSGRSPSSASASPWGWPCPAPAPPRGWGSCSSSRSSSSAPPCPPRRWESPELDLRDRAPHPRGALGAGALARSRQPGHPPGSAGRSGRGRHRRLGGPGRSNRDMSPGHLTTDRPG